MSCRSKTGGRKPAGALRLARLNPSQQWDEALDRLWAFVWS